MVNKLNGSLRLIESAVNGHPYKMFKGSKNPEVPDEVTFEHNGDMYIPRGDKTYQVALHMKYQYGVDYTWGTYNTEGKEAAGAGGKPKYLIYTSKLVPSVRDAALADMNERLKQDWNASDVHAATVLRKKLKIGKPLPLGPKQ